MKDFLTALGLALIIEGMPYFLSPPRMREWLKQLMAVPDPVMRRMGLMLMGVGLWLVYMVRGG